jgi:tRNA A-37 threonylcarbamoyl transferase component Bud32
MMQLGCENVKQRHNPIRTQWMVKIQPVYEFWRSHFQSQSHIHITASHLGLTPPLIAFWMVGDVGYTIQRRISGQTLDDVIRADPARMDPALIQTCLDILCKLSVIQVVHRDVHLGNWMVEPSGRVWLIDWGEAQWSLLADDYRRDVLMLISEFEYAFRDTLTGAIMDGPGAPLGDALKRFAQHSNLIHAI